MKPFLKQVADHYYKKGDIEGKCFVFPNRRSMVFFRQWLGAAVAEVHAAPLIAPEMYTVNDLFHKIGGLHATDKVTLLVELYECYSRLNPKAEPLDEFVFWGDVILADFNDTDKYLADPKQLYANVADFKAIQDTFSYLTPTQRQAVESFISHFSDRNGRLTVDLESEDPGVKERFLQIWNMMYPLYMMFNEHLRGKGMAYEGMVYRSFADSLAVSSAADLLDEIFKPETTFVFVGLNALNECEKTLLRRLKDCGRAEFCWDWSGSMIRDEKNRASFFMADNFREFPPTFRLDDEGVGKAEFNSLSVPSSYGQVKYLAPVLERMAGGGRLPCGATDTAVVLPDESLLIPLLNSVPEEVEEVNVTMGYPMAAGELYVLVRDLARMQMHLRQKESGWHFYHKQVWDVLSSGLIRSLTSVEGMEECRRRISQVKQDGRYYIPQSDLEGFPLLETLFRPVVRDLSLADVAQTDELAQYLQDVVAALAPKLSAIPDMEVELEFARKCYGCINSLRAKKLAVQPMTFIRLLDSLMNGLTVPFKGEPLKGLQIMGPLETRALDFRNVIIFSCNEGMFPRRNVSSSFIPPELRKAFGLPTYEYQDAIWAYYFYRLVSRAENVWMIYDSRTEGLKRGEESRYIKQLKYHFGIEVKHHVAEAELSACSQQGDEIVKTDEMMQRIDGLTFSVSALQNYVICPARFCYRSVLKLSKEEEIAESLDNAMIGNVYHNLMWALYYGESEMKSDAAFEKLDSQPEKGMDFVSAGYLRDWLGREAEIKTKVESLMKSELNTDEISGRDLVVLRVIVRYVMETLRKELLLLERHGSEGFAVHGLERKVTADMYGVRFFGVIDRIDSLTPGMVRLVDYKTGNDSPSVIAVTDAQADDAVQRIFDGTYEQRKTSKAALQFHIYDRMAAEADVAKAGDMVCNSLYATSDLFRNVPAVMPVSERFSQLMDERLQALVDQIRSKDVPFRRTEETDACRYCDFKMICGR